MAKQKGLSRDFKGVWIPKEIWLNEMLSITEKAFLVEIDSLDNENGCFAGNEHFAKFSMLSVDRASKIISCLEKKGLIKVSVEKKSGKSVRTIRVISRDGRTFCKDTTRRKQRVGIVENAECPLGENAEYSNTYPSNTGSIPPTPQGGKDETALALSSDEEKNIGEVIHLFRDVNPTYNQLFQRRAHREASRRMIQSFGMEKIRAATLFLTACISRGDRFCPRITTPIQLETKWGELQAHYLVVKNEAQSGVQKGGIYAI